MPITRYDGFTRALHWLMALLLLSQFVKLVEYVDGGEAWFRSTFGPYHSSIGFVLLLLALVRISWVLVRRDQRPALIGSPVAAMLASLGHKLLYLGMLALPLTGIAKLVGNGWGLTVFGNALIARGDKINWLIPLGEWHAPLSWVLALLIVGHILMGLLHHFILKDGSLRKIL